MGAGTCECPGQCPWILLPLLWSSPRLRKQPAIPHLASQPWEGPSTVKVPSLATQRYKMTDWHSDLCLHLLRGWGIPPQWSSARRAGSSGVAHVTSWRHIPSKALLGWPGGLFKLLSWLHAANWAQGQISSLRRMSSWAETGPSLPKVHARRGVPEPFRKTSCHPSLDK